MRQMTGRIMSKKTAREKIMKEKRKNPPLSKFSPPNPYFSFM